MKPPRLSYFSSLFPGILLGCFAVAAFAAPGPSSEAIPKRPRIGLVLSGGAARGSAHVGVLQVLEEHRIPVDFVAGTSMGAIVGGLYACGLSVKEMNEILVSTDWNDLFTDSPPRNKQSFRRKQDDLEALIKIELGWRKGITLPASLVAGDKLMFFLRKLTLHTHQISNFDELPIPFRAVATDIETGDMVVLRRGNVAEALRASMAIPGAFAAQEIDGRLLADGFLTQNLPVGLALEWGADVIIAVDVGAPLNSRSELKSLLNYTAQTLTMMSRRNTKEQVALLRPQDTLIQPSLGTIKGLNFDRSAEAIALGRQATLQVIASLDRYALSASNYAAWNEAKHRKLTDSIRIDAVRIENAGLVPDKVLERRAHIKTGESVKVEEIRRKLDHIYDIGAFDAVDYKLESHGETNELVIRPRDRVTGPIRIRAGLRLFSDLDGDSDFNFLTSVTATELNPLGAEWKNQVQFGRTTRVFSEWYQPLEYSRSYFIAPYADLTQDRTESLLANGTLIRARYRRFGGGMDAGAQISNFGEIRVGPVWGRTKVYELTGPGLPSSLPSITDAGAHIRLSLDHLDQVDFPRRGYLGGLDFYTSSQALGADQEYNRLLGLWNQAFSFGDNALLFSVNAASKLGPDLPFYENFSLGGFLNLSGYPYQGLSDQYLAIGRIIYYRELIRSNKRLLEAIYLGGSFETGGVWHTFDSISPNGLVFAGSVFLAAETIMGPLYFAYGQAEGGNHAFYFYLGRGF